MSRSVVGNRRGRALVLFVAAVLLVLGAPAVSAAAPIPPLAATITSVPFGWGGDSDDPNLDGAAATRAVAASCVGGAPLWYVHWFAFTPAVTTSVLAQADMKIFPDREAAFVGAGVAILDAGQHVLACGTASGVASTGLVTLAAHATAYVVAFATENDWCGEFICFDSGQQVAVTPAAPQPADDDWQNAARVTSMPFTTTVDTSLATHQDGPDRDNDPGTVCSADPVTMQHTVWYAFTPATSGPLTLSTSRGEIFAAEEGPDGPLWPDDPTCQNLGNPTTYLAGHTYLIEVGVGVIDIDGSDGVGLGGPTTVTISGGPAPLLPDLVVTKLTAGPVAPTSGQPVVFSATVRNQGKVATSGNQLDSVIFQIDGTTVTYDHAWTGALAPGASVTLTANSGPSGSGVWYATAGTHTLRGYVDDIRTIAEANESNNALSVPLTVGSGPALPDLVVTAITASPAHPAPGQPVTFAATVRNRGTGPTPAGVVDSVLFQVDGVSVAWNHGFAAALAPGRSVTLTATAGPSGKATWTATAGVHAVKAAVDDIRRIAEADESNNEMFVPLTVGSVGPRPDLVVTAVTTSPSAPRVGQPVTFTATVRNRGTQVTPGSVAVGFVRFGAPASTSLVGTAGPIPVGGYAMISAATTWTPSLAGAVPFVATADPTGVIPELDKTNNRLPFWVTAG